MRPLSLSIMRCCNLTLSKYPRNFFREANKCNKTSYGKESKLFSIGFIRIKTILCTIVRLNYAVE